MNTPFSRAFVPGPRCTHAATGHGPLDGLRMAVKDLIDVRGAITGGGTPDWAAAQRPAAAHSPAVASCLAAGANVVGKTVTDELAFSLEGDNAHHGTPLNARAPHRLPGGSSSGSASAVACGEADVALGTDTGGSVRVPASLCGLFGMRPSHGRIPLDGVVPFAPSLDTIGWFSRDAHTLHRVGRVLLGLPKACPTAPQQSLPALTLLNEAWSHTDAEVCKALHPTVEALTGDTQDHVFDAPMSDWLRAYQVLQGDEIRQHLGPWLRHQYPRLGANVAPRFASIWDIDPTEVRHWQGWRAAQRERLHAHMTAQPRIWVLPTVPTVPLTTTATASERASFYERTLPVCALASLLGWPQLTLPVSTLADGSPIGLSLIGAHDTDQSLLDFATQLIKD